MSRLTLTGLAGALALAACADTVAVRPLAEAQRFFNLPEWVALQDSLLEGRGLEKTVVVDDVEQTKHLEAVAWAEELAPFAQSDIDRPALWDRYAVDTTAAEGGAAVIVYEALDEDLFTRRVEVAVGPGGEVTRLVIDNAFASFVADTEQRLEWAPGRYAVYSRQEARLADPRELRIEGNW